MPLVVQSNRESARAVDGIFIPAGEAWRLLHEADPAIAVYGPDKFHPSELGSFLAALTIYERLSGRDVRSIPLKAFVGAREIALPAATVGKLHEAAHGAILLHQSTNLLPAIVPRSLVHTQGC